MENTAPKQTPFDRSVEVRVPAFDAITYTESQCALQLRTIVSDITFEGHWLEVKGWAQSLWVPVECCTMLLNGKEFSETTWIRDASLEGHFGRLPSSGNRRYICRQAFANLDDIFHEGFARISFVQDRTETQRTYRSTWYYPDIRNVGPIPSEEQISRVIGGQNAIQPYLMGGATIFSRYDGYLREQFGRSLREFRSILDWGCGSGRLTRYLGGLVGPRVSGIDIDRDNIAWCKANIPNANFFEGPLSPPTGYQNEEFDLLIGTSVFTHLDEEQQFLWLQELQRISAAGAVLLMTKTGPSLMALNRWTDELYIEMERKGFLLIGQNSQLDAVVSDKSYYKDVAQSETYIFAEWSKYFEIIDIVPAMAANQDVVVMRRRSK
jgi:2-polyprenyl-3-methyl-5-hydroxy-6-metoxy-1,4-benzoquinol methylase